MAGRGEERPRADPPAQEHDPEQPRDGRQQERSEPPPVLARPAAREHADRERGGHDGERLAGEDGEAEEGAGREDAGRSGHPPPDARAHQRGGEELRRRPVEGHDRPGERDGERTEPPGAATEPSEARHDKRGGPGREPVDDHQCHTHPARPAEREHPGRIGVQGTLGAVGRLARAATDHRHASQTGVGGDGRVGLPVAADQLALEHRRRSVEGRDQEVGRLDRLPRDRDERDGDDEGEDDEADGDAEGVFAPLRPHRRG
jgi:hypothetical protein